MANKIERLVDHGDLTPLEIMLKINEIVDHLNKQTAGGREDRTGRANGKLKSEIAHIQNRQYDKQITIAEAINQILALIQESNKETEKKAASKIFNLAHKYAQEDKTMRGAEELRAYHYYNAIHKIGEFDGR